MLTRTRLDRSAELVQGMAERTGTNLATPTNAVQFRSLVMRCSACGKQDACTNLQADSTSLDQAPDYCRNGAFFA